MPSREDLVLKKVKEILDRYRMFFVRCNPTNGIGYPDIIACIDGRFVGIEVKDDKNGEYGVTEAQKARMRAIEKSGGYCLVIDKNNLGWFECHMADVHYDRLERYNEVMERSMDI